MSSGKFGFIVHPTEMSFVYKKYPLARFLPEKVVKGAMRHAPPVTVSHATGIRSELAETEGWFVGTVLTPDQMMNLPSDYVTQKIIDACHKAEQLGADVIGLGAYTAIVGDAGQTIARECKAAITTGNSYTVAAALEAAELGAQRLGHDVEQALFAVVGATGSIGAACARVLASRGRRLVLVGRDRTRLERLAADIQAESGRTVQVSTDIRRTLPSADVVIAVSSAVEAIIQPEDLKPGAVVCDVAMPRDVDERVKAVRDDVLVMDGGLIEVPGKPNFNFDFGFPPGYAMACMSETILLALEGRFENFTLGRDLTVAQIEEISRLARKHGFRVAGIRSFHRALDDATIARIKANAQRRLASWQAQAASTVS